MSSSRQFAIMSLPGVRNNISKCVPIIYRILQYHELSLEKAQCPELENTIKKVVIGHISKGLR